ncbi:MAG: TIGR00730 family Rossman fold protein [Rhodospirillaceae bacterium]
MAAHIKVTSLCVFCGANTGTRAVYRDGAAALGRAMAANATALVYGGGRVGMMGAISDAVIRAGGKVTGVIPDFLVDKELAHPEATEMVVVPDMHARKKAMFDLSEAFCVLPGGVGTLDETFEIITWRQLHRHNKPIVLLNIDGYWSHLVGLMDRIIEEGFMHKGNSALVTVVDRPEDVIGAIEAELAAPKAPAAFIV